MRVLIIGGNRFFGLHLAKNLIAAKHQVTLLNRGQLDDGLGDQVTRLKADRKIKKSLLTAVKDETWDLIYDQVCYTAEEARIACDVFVKRTPRYVVTSSGSVYNDGVNQVEGDFDPKLYSFTKEYLPTENYQEAKRQVETAFAHSDFKQVVMVRPSLVVGTDDYTGRIKWHIDRISKGLPIYFPDIHIHSDYIRSDQAALAMQKIGESNVVGPVNCTEPASLSLKSLIEMCEEATGRKAILADEESEENYSPIGAPVSRTMSTELLQSLGVAIEPSEKWMKSLVKELFI